MKASKALKRLTDVEESLSKVIDRYTTDERKLVALLEEAKGCVVHAKETLSAQAHHSAGNGHSMKPRKRDSQPQAAGAGKPAAPEASTKATPKKAIGRRGIVRKVDAAPKQSDAAM